MHSHALVEKRCSRVPSLASSFVWLSMFRRCTLMFYANNSCNRSFQGIAFGNPFSDMLALSDLFALDAEWLHSAHRIRYFINCKIVLCALHFRVSAFCNYTFANASVYGVVKLSCLSFGIQLSNFAFCTARHAICCISRFCMRMIVRDHATLRLQLSSGSSWSSQ